jgi:hypothetical protein
MSKPTKEDAYRKADELALEICGTIHGVPGEMECELAAEVRHAICTTKMLLSPDVKRDDAIDAACGSSARLECLLIMAQDLRFFREVDLERYLERVRDLEKALRKLNSKLRASGS